MSDEHACASGFTYHDAIMSPFLGSEKPSAVRISIGHTYYILAGEKTHSEVALRQNYMCSRHNTRGE